MGANGDRPSLDDRPITLGPKAALVPVKAFAEAKQRLGPALSPPDRARLARAMAERVLVATEPLPVAVVCDDLAVAGWARERGALVIWEPGRGLNGAVEAGVDHLSSMGVEQVTVAHGDLPYAAGLATVGATPGITLVPDRARNGTNVISIPTGCGFHFAYGPGSFARHRAEAARIGLPVHVVEDPCLALDIDEPADVWTLLAQPAASDLLR